MSLLNIAKHLYEREEDHKINITLVNLYRVNGHVINIVNQMTEERHIYYHEISGDTYPIKEQLKALGFEWDKSKHAFIRRGDTRNYKIETNLISDLKATPIDMKAELGLYTRLINAFAEMSHGAYDHSRGYEYLRVMVS